MAGENQPADYRRIGDLIDKTRARSHRETTEAGEKLCGFGESALPMLLMELCNSECNCRAIALPFKAIGSEAEKHLAGLALNEAVVETIRQNSISVLGEIGGKTAVSILLAALESGTLGEKKRALGALAKIADPSSVEGIIRAAGEKGLRSEANEALSKIKSPKAEEYFVAALKDRRACYEARLCAPAGLELNWKEGHAGLLIPCLKGRNEDMVGIAANVLGDKKVVASVPALIGALKRCKEEWTLGRIASALGRIGNDEAALALIREFEGNRFAGLEDWDGSYARGVIGGICLCRNPAVLPCLKRAIGKYCNDEGRMEWLLDLCGACGGAGEIPHLAGWLASPNMRIRSGALLGLLETRTEEGTMHFIAHVAREKDEYLLDKMEEMVIHTVNPGALPLFRSALMKHEFITRRKHIMGMIEYLCEKKRAEGNDAPSLPMADADLQGMGLKNSFVRRNSPKGNIEFAKPPARARVALAGA